MKTPSALLTLSSLLLLSPISSSSAQLLPFFRSSSASASAAPQAPSLQTMPDITALTISDILSQTKTINIFAGFTRDISSVSGRLDASNQNTTLLAPTNSAITALPRKPWESPKDYDSLGAQAYLGQEGEDRAQGNLRRFVESHVVPESPWEEGRKVKSLGGGEVWWESKEGVRTIQPGNVQVESITNTVSNGEVWVVKGVVNYAE